MEIICLLLAVIQLCVLVFMFLGFMFLGGRIGINTNIVLLLGLWSVFNFLCATVGVFYNGNNDRNVKYFAITSNVIFWVCIYVMMIKLYA